MSVFGTCFVTYSCYDYVDFAKNYNTQGVYHFGIYDKACVGYNSLLLSPKGINWAKNFSKIIFLSPVLDTGFLKALKEVSGAEIFVPIDKKLDTKHFSSIDLSRGTFGKIYTALASKSGRNFYNVFDLFENLNLQNINFYTFFSAFQVFKELELISVNENDMLTIYANKQNKKQLDSSYIYVTLNALKNSNGGENAR